MCRISLEEITKKEQHLCTNVAKCAQCEGEYYSLYGQCPVIQLYRTDLKEDVTNELASGKLHRNDYTKQQPGFTMINQDFPPLNESKKHQQNAWNHVQKEIRNNDTPDSTNALLLIDENLVAMRESNRRLELKLEKIDSKLNQTALDIELHQATVDKLIEHVQAIIEHIVCPVTSHIRPDLLNSTKGLQSIFDKLRDLKTNLHNDYEIRRKRAASPSTQDKSLVMSEETNNGESNNCGTIISSFKFLLDPLALLFFLLKMYPLLT